MSDGTPEIWKPVPGYEGSYDVSNFGRVWGVKRERLKKPSIDPQGYPYVSLSRGAGQSERRSVHNLVTRAFLGPLSPGKEVLHGDGDPGNSALSNLSYDTRRENVLDRVRHGTHHMANKTHCKHGHEFTPENTYTPPAQPGSRQCRTCHGVKDLSIPPRRVEGRTHCCHGHEFTPANTYVDKKGTRRCRECSRISDSARLAQRSAARRAKNAARRRLPAQDVLSI